MCLLVPEGGEVGEVVKCAGEGGFKGGDNVKEEQKGVKRGEGGFGK